MSTKTSNRAKPSTGDKPGPEGDKPSAEGAKPEAPPESASPGEKAGPGALLRKNGPLVAAFVGVAAVGVIIGRASSAPHETPPAARSARPSASAPFTAEPQQFDLHEVPGSKAGVPLRPMDRDIIDAIQNVSFDESRMKDLFPDRPYRVRLIGSIHERRIGLVMIDTNRDGKFDERWDLTRTEISRVIHDDASTDGAPVKYTLGHGRWQVH